MSRLNCVFPIFVGFALAAGNAFANQPNQSHGPNPVDPGVYSKLQAAADGKAYVIVILQPPAPEDSKTHKRHKAVSQVQQTLLTRLSADEFAPVYRYKNFAAMTGRVNAAGLAKLADSPEVIAVGTDGTGHAHMTSSIPFINADDVHSLGYTGDGITVAVLDSGIDKNHADLSDNIAPGWYHFLGQGSDYGPGAWNATNHGTNVAGIITSKGVYAGVGVAPDADILAIKVINSSNRYYFSDLAAGIDYVVDHQSDYDNLCVMNMSLGSDDLFTQCPCDNVDANTILIHTAIQAAKHSGIVTFASSGNDCSCTSMSSPACLSSATAVAAVYDQDFGSYSCCGCTDSQTGPDKITCFSNRSNCNELAAPGVKIWGPEPNDYNDYWYTGTSQAAPHCAGVAALMEEKAADVGIALSPDRIVQIMKDTGVATEDECETSPNPIRVDALAAVNDVGSEPKPTAEHLKWSQPPIEIMPDPMTTPKFCGWDQNSWTDDPCTLFWQPVADDFRCFGSMPITTIHWWGSYSNWAWDYPPPQQPLSWLLRFYENIPEPEDPQQDPNYSHPGQILWESQVPADRVHVDWVGMDDYPMMPPETCFQFYLELEPNEYFWQADYNDLTEDSIYWLGIAAVYANDVNVAYPWGWKTRPVTWMDDAVNYECRMVYDPELGWIFVCRHWPIKDPISGDSVDVAFELGTDANYIKWEQQFTGIRDWPHYEDQVSMGTDIPGSDPNVSILAADDWECSQRLPVTSMAWWGSYLGYSYEACETYQALPPDEPLYFWLTIWDDVPDPNPADPNTFSHPNDVIWQYKAYDYDEVMVGFDKYPAVPVTEPVFRYALSLPENNWFYQQDVNGIYWLGIVAVFSQEDPEYEWGWTNHPYNFKDYAVKGCPNDVRGWDWQVLEDQTQSGEDLSFTLFTEPDFCINCPDYDFSALVDYYDLKVFADDWLWSGSAGGYTYGDLDCDGDVEFDDYALFALQWLGNCP